MNIYLDTCCYGRPCDDPTQIKIAIETAAIKGIIDTCRIAGHCIVGSMAVTSEIEENRDAYKQKKTRAFFDSVMNVYVTTNDDARAQALQAEGLKRMDSYHLMFAEIANADVLLTTDKDFIRICARKKISVVRVINPLNFIQEVIN